jgi:hypothetical protein
MVSRLYSFSKRIGLFKESLTRAQKIVVAIILLVIFGLSILYFYSLPLNTNYAESYTLSSWSCDLQQGSTETLACSFAFNLNPIEGKITIDSFNLTTYGNPQLTLMELNNQHFSTSESGIGFFNEVVQVPRTVNVTLGQNLEYSFFFPYGKEIFGVLQVK